MASSALIASEVNNLLGYQATQTTQEANAAAQRTTAAGYGAEVTSYKSGEDIARQNALLEGISGDIQSIQQLRDLGISVGATRAAVAGAGFKESGSAVDQIASDLRLGYMNNQLIKTQSSITAGGFMEQAAADKAQADAARMAQQSASDTAAAYDRAAALTKTNYTNATAALTKYLKDTGATDAETQLATGVLGNKDINQLYTSATTGTSSSLYPRLTRRTALPSDFGNPRNAYGARI